MLLINTPFEGLMNANTHYWSPRPPGLGEKGRGASRIVHAYKLFLIPWGGGWGSGA